ncbi:MAG TPA: Crp/Fnr family transcriptional regulator [Propylenella sp.]|nr:Crp/Fnr family transcriptional regulator [Propylenella sp.]
MTASGDFLSRLAEEDRAALAARWAVRQYQRDEMIIAHDESGRDVFFVLEGRARVTVFSERGRAVAFRDMEPGDIFGELAAIDGRARSASVVALEPMRAARLSDTAFRQIVNARPTFTWALLEHLSAQVRRLTDRVYEFSTLVVRKRLVRELLRLAGAAEQREGPALIAPVPTHYELATRISTHREAVSREMSALAKRKLITKSGSNLLLRDLDILKALAASDDER